MASKPSGTSAGGTEAKHAAVAVHCRQWLWLVSSVAVAGVVAMELALVYNSVR